MPAWGRTDTYTDKPKFPKERTEHGVIKISANAATFPTNILSFTPNATIGLANGWVANGVNIGNTVGYVGYNLIGPSIVGLTSNTVTLSQNVGGNIGAGTIIKFSKPIPSKAGRPAANSYNANTVLVTTTRKANASANAAHSIAHIGWNHVKVGTGRKAGRVMIETLVALSNPKANIANSGGTYFPGL